MLGFKWIKRVVLRNPTPGIVLGDRPNAAFSHINIKEDGSKHEFVYGTVNSKKVGGHKPVTIIDVEQKDVSTMSQGEEYIRAYYAKETRKIWRYVLLKIALVWGGALVLLYALAKLLP